MCKAHVLKCWRRLTICSVLDLRYSLSLFNATAQCTCMFPCARARHGACLCCNVVASKCRNRLASFCLGCASSQMCSSFGVCKCGRMWSRSRHGWQAWMRRWIQAVGAPVPMCGCERNGESNRKTLLPPPATPTSPSGYVTSASYHHRRLQNKRRVVAGE